jgi:hypothetical protein
MPKGVHGKSAEQTKELFAARAQAELARVSQVLDGGAVTDEVVKMFTDLEASLEKDTNDWKVVIRGKQVLATFAGRADISLPRAKTIYIAEAMKQEDNPFAEVIEQFNAMSR